MTQAARAASVRRPDCRLCASLKLEAAFSLKPTPVADHYLKPDEAGRDEPRYPLDLALCADCGHLQLRDAVDPEILFGSYTFVTSASLGLIEAFRQGAKRLLAVAEPAPGALAVDIGSNDGSQLRFFKEAGLRVLGVDPARAIAARATAAGIETWPEYFTAELGRRIRSALGEAAIVTANNVFAHADDLGGMADGVREILAPGGVFSFEVSYLADTLRGMLFDTIYHEHVCYHSVEPLRSFFDRHGLQLFDVERIGAKGGSIRGLVQRKGGPRPESPAVGEMVALEERLGLRDLATWHRFAERIDQAKERLLEAVDLLRSQGKHLAGYGASVTVTTLLHHFELGSRLDFLVDDNPVKQGTLSPGYHLPVLPSRALYERKPDRTLILAWKYADPILSRHAAYLKAGGGFLIPLPELRTVTAG